MMILKFRNFFGKMLSKPQSHYFNNVAKRAPRIGAGVPDFRKLVESSSVIVDKSLLIKEFYQDKGKVLLLTFPRRWGKTMNMFMIKNFFQIEVDEKGNILEKKLCSNYKLFEGGEIEIKQTKTKTKIQIDALKIAKDTIFMDEFQGQLPVVHIDFKNCAKDSYEEVFISVQTEIEMTYLEHKYLLNSDKLDQSDKEILEPYFSRKKLTEEQVEQSLFDLCRLLHKHFGKKCIVLVDEYDSPINKSYLNGYEDAGKILQIFRDINLCTFKGNEYMDKGLITGILRIARANMFSDLNNLSEYNILNEDYSKYYGFTDDEVKKLTKNFKIPDTLAEDIKQWYNGYNVDSLEIFNPWSIVLCLDEYLDVNPNNNYEEIKEKIIKNYWEESGSLEFILPVLKKVNMRFILGKLVKGESIGFELIEKFSSDDFTNLYKIMQRVHKSNLFLKTNNKVMDEVSIENINATEKDLILSFLFSTGYLTLSKEKSTILKLYKMPNEEIKSVFKNYILKYYANLYGFDYYALKDCGILLHNILYSKDDVLLNAARETFEIKFNYFLNTFPGFVKICPEDIFNEIKYGKERKLGGNEDIIHTLMNVIGLMAYYDIFGTEVYRGDNRADIVIVYDSYRQGAIIEVKYQYINDKIPEPIKQIETKQYAKQFKENKEIKHILLMGVTVTDDKECEDKECTAEVKKINL